MRSKTFRRRGSVLLLSAFAIVVLLICLAVAIDAGRLMLTRTELQAAADAAALAGAAVLPDGPHEVRAIAQRYAEMNRSGGERISLQPRTDVELGDWDDAARTFRLLEGSDEDRADAVRVTCSRTQSRGNAVPMVFGRLLGIDRTDLQATATAKLKSWVCGQIVGLDRVTMSGSSYTDSYLSDEGPYSAARAGASGHVCSNGLIGMSGQTRIIGDAHPGPGQSVIGGGTVTGTIAANDQQLDFPAIDPGDAATNNDNGQIPRTAQGNEAVGANGDFRLARGDEVTLPGGVYHFSNMTLSGGSVVHVSGPTVIFVEGNCSLSGGSLANPAQKPADLQLFCSGALCGLSGSSEFYGVVYAPNARVVRSGSSHFYGMIVGRELALSGSGGIHADASLDPLKGTANRSVLVD